jgi:hypothetical protein
MQTVKLIPEYEKKLKDFEKKLIKAQQFSEKLPCFSDFIIKNVITGERFVNLGLQYKTLKFSCNIQRTEYETKNNRTTLNRALCLPENNNSKTMHNKDAEHSPIMLTKICINTALLFGYGTSIKAPSNIECYLFDSVNSIYYATDEELEHVLDSLVEWYNDSMTENKKDQHVRKIKDAEKRLQLIEEEIARLKQSEYEHDNH